MSAGRRAAGDLGAGFRRLWLATWVSSTGDGMVVVVLPLAAALVTRDPILVAGLTTAARLPWLLLSLLTGAFADRLDRRRLMVGADACRLAVTGATGAAVLAGAANIWVLYACAFLLGLFETLHVNCAQGLLPALVPSGSLLPANARLSSAQIAAAQFAGPPIGVGLFGAAPALPFLANAVTFAASGALVAGIPSPPPAPAQTTRIRDDIIEGVRFVRGHAAIRRLVEIVAFVNFFYFAAASLLVLYNEEILGGGNASFTAMSVGAAAGTVASRFLVAPVSRRLGDSRTIAVSIWTWAATITGLAVAPNPAFAVAMFTVLGVGNGLWISLTTTIRQRLTPARMLGRGNAVFRTVSWGVVPFGAALGGVIARFAGLRAPFIVAAVATLLCAVFSRRLLRPVTELGATSAPR